MSMRVYIRIHSTVTYIHVYVYFIVIITKYIDCQPPIFGLCFCNQTSQRWTARRDVQTESKDYWLAKNRANDLVRL